MLATFIIGLREGLEASLIVGIIAAFLVKNGRRLTPMWLGVGAAVLLSLGVGITLSLVERSLPQAAQEGMETVIGAVAVFFVTGMILWMSSHSRGLKRELETTAQEALGGGASSALVVMAFLAVLKEGFETAVFLLATFQASTSAVAAAVGALLGMLVSIGLGIAIYRGGVRINLSKFFRATGVFLVLVASGLVVSALRTAHEAGWLNAGQQRTFDLSWLAPVGSVRGALFTGVLGIPADPRLVEVVGWLCYLVPMMLIVLWPPAKRPSPAAGIRIRQVLAGAAVLAAGLLAVLVSTPALSVPASAPLVDGNQSSIGTGRLPDSSTLETTIGGKTSTTKLAAAGSEEHAGVLADHLTAGSGDAAKGLPSRVTLEQLVALNGGRVPVGVDVQRNPGPYAAAWSGSSEINVWVVNGALFDASSQDTLVLTLSGGGLPTARTLTVSAGAALPGDQGSAGTSWSMAGSYVDQVAHTVRTYENAQVEARFWGRFVPLVLLVTAALLLLIAWRRRWALASSSPTPVGHASSATGTTSSTSPRSNAHAG